MSDVDLVVDALSDVEGVSAVHAMTHKAVCARVWPQNLVDALRAVEHTTHPETTTHAFLERTVRHEPTGRIHLEVDVGADDESWKYGWVECGYVFSPATGWVWERRGGRG